MAGGSASNLLGQRCDAARLRQQCAAVEPLTLYLICGLPGAGKTTRSLAIAKARRAVHLCPDEWVLGLGQSLVDFEFRIKLQTCLLTHAAALLRCGVSVIIDFGSWHRQERETIRQTALAAGAVTELHHLDAPLDELVRRVRARGRQFDEALASGVLIRDAAAFERPGAEEAAGYDRYFGPNDRWVN